MAKNTNFLYRIDMLLLSILENQDCYGYEMVKQIKKKTNDIISLKQGTMYPILYDLLDKKYITSYDKTVDKKVRVYYHLEPLGKEYLSSLIQEYENTIFAINQIIYKQRGK